ncbi:MAG: hypothetical protein JWP52_873 [Rhizobacter sp.]|nr:hypothetical protein [Rhizobacter sp.]
MGNSVAAVLQADESAVVRVAQGSIGWPERLPFRRMLDLCPWPVVLVKRDASDTPVVYANAALCSLTGQGPTEWLQDGVNLLHTAPGANGPNVALNALIRDGLAGLVTLRSLRKDGSSFWNRVTVTPLTEAGEPNMAPGEAAYCLCVCRDVTLQTEWEVQVQRLLPFVSDVVPSDEADVLTHIARGLNGADLPTSRGVLLLIGLALPVSLEPDLVSRTAILTVALHRAQRLLPSPASVMTLPGLRLLMVLSKGMTPVELTELARGLCAELGLPMDIGPTMVMLDVTAGLALAPDDGSEPRSLLAQATTALALARAGGIDAVRFANPSVDAQRAERHWIRRDLPQAIAGNQFVLHYQPVVHVETGAVRSFEALIRWVHPQQGLVSPDRFVPEAEQAGLMVPLTLWVIEAALMQLAAWEAAGHRGLRMAINLSAEEVGSDLFETRLCEALDRWHVPAWQLVLELTERTFIRASQTSVDRLQRLRKMGMEVAIDDFGTGYASLATVAQLPVDIVKIDMSFTRGALQRHSDAAVCGAIRELARSLQLRCVAEGIETVGQAGFFSRLGCDELQGFHFSQPLESSEATALLESSPHYEIGDRGHDILAQRHLLLLDEEPDTLLVLRHLLQRDGYLIHATTAASEAFELLALHPVGVVISGQRLSATQDGEFLSRVKSLYPSTVRIMLSAFIEVQAVTEAVNEGAVYKLLAKPWNDQQLAKHVKHGFELFEMASQAERLHEELRKANQRLEALASLQGHCLEVEQHALAAVRETLAVLPVPVISVDGEGRIVLSNMAADRWFCRGGSLLGRGIRGVLPEAEWLLLQVTGASTVMIDGRSWGVHRNLIGENSDSEAAVLSFLPEA